MCIRDRCYTGLPEDDSSRLIVRPNGRGEWRAWQQGREVVVAFVDLQQVFTVEEIASRAKDAGSEILYLKTVPKEANDRNSQLSKAGVSFVWIAYNSSKRVYCYIEPEPEPC